MLRLLALEHLARPDERLDRRFRYKAGDCSRRLLLQLVESPTGFAHHRFDAHRIEKGYQFLVIYRSLVNRHVIEQLFVVGVKVSFLGTS